MPFITLVGLFCLDLKMQECGMPWVVVTKRLEKRLKHKNVMKGQNVPKTDKESQFIKWQNCTTQWDHNLN